MEQWHVYQVMNIGHSISMVGNGLQVMKNAEHHCNSLKRPKCVNHETQKVTIFVFMKILYDGLDVSHED